MNKYSNPIKERIYQFWTYLVEEIILERRKEQIKTLKRKIKWEWHEGEELKKLFL